MELLPEAACREGAEEMGLQVEVNDESNCTD